MAKTIEELKAQTRPTLKGNRVRGNSRLSKGQNRKGKGYSEPAASGMLRSSAASFALVGTGFGMAQQEASFNQALAMQQAQSQQSAHQQQMAGMQMAGQSGLIRVRRPAWGNQYGNG